MSWKYFKSISICRLVKNYIQDKFKKIIFWLWYGILVFLLKPYLIKRYTDLLSYLLISNRLFRTSKYSCIFFMFLRFFWSVNWFLRNPTRLIQQTRKKEVSREIKSLNPVIAVKLRSKRSVIFIELIPIFIMMS